MKKRIHVNQHIIKANQKSGDRQAPLTMKTYKENTKASRIEILDAAGSVVAAVIYSPDKPLHCGATVWIETDAETRAI